MSYCIKLRLDEEVTNYVRHKYRIFGTDLWREFKDECEVSLEEIDSCHDTFYIRKIKQRRLKSIIAKIEGIAEQHFFAETLEIESTRDHISDQ